LEKEKVMYTLGRELIKESVSMLKDKNASGIVSLAPTQAKMIRNVLKACDDLLARLDRDYSDHSDEWASWE